jgi:hypothetical protein
MTLSGTCRTGDERCERELSALSLAGRTLEGPLELGALLEETGEGRLDLVDGLCGMDRSLTRERRGVGWRYLAAGRQAVQVAEGTHVRTRARIRWSGQQTW